MGRVASHNAASHGTSYEYGALRIVHVRKSSYVHGHPDIKQDVREKPNEVGWFLTFDSFMENHSLQDKPME